MKKAIALLLIAIFHLTLVIGNLSFAAEYVLAPSDQLEVRIIGQKDLDTKQSIAPDGTISLPFLGRVTAQGQTLKGFDENLTAEFAKYLSKPSQIVVYLTPRPIYVIQHDVRKNNWEVKEAKSIDEARALAGKNYTGEIKPGDTISVDVGEKPDWWEGNWYKVLTATAVAVGIYATLHK
jgi:protein involved in polysaccharide export with SLBB domain